MSDGAVCKLPDLRIKPDGRVPVVNSRDVAEVFEKEHRHVLRDIDLLLSTRPDLGRCGWFREVQSQVAGGNGAVLQTRSFDMTRDGFTLLAMGWTGERAMQFKVAYIQAFNAMEAELSSRSLTSTDLIAAVREIVAPLAVRHDGHDKALERVEDRIDGVSDRVDGLAVDLFDIKRAIAERSRRIMPGTKETHLVNIRALGGRCPCCGFADLIDAQGCALPFVEFDHFYRNSYPDLAHTWPLCKPCHTKFTTGRVARTDRLSEFSAYQEKSRRLPGRQPNLFG